MAPPRCCTTLLVDRPCPVPEHHATKSFSANATFVADIGMADVVASLAGAGANTVNCLGTPLPAADAGIAVCS